MSTKKQSDSFRMVNRRAYHDYSVLSTLECGICLHGTEVKSIRASRASFAGAYAEIEAGELWLIGLHVSEYMQRGYAQHDVLRKRRLLAHKREIRKLARQVMEKRMTLIPLKIYETNHRLKLELGVCRGKREYDKRQTMKEETQKQELRATRYD